MYAIVAVRIWVCRPSRSRSRRPLPAAHFPLSAVRGTQPSAACKKAIDRSDKHSFAMGSTVRIRDDTREELHALQARIGLAERARVPLEEVLDRAIRFASAHEREFLDADEPPRLCEEDVAFYLALIDEVSEPVDLPDVGGEDAEIYGEHWR